MRNNVKPSICNNNDLGVSITEICEIYDWLIPVAKVEDIEKANRDHAYITADEKMYILNYEGTELTEVTEVLWGEISGDILEQTDIVNHIRDTQKEFIERVRVNNIEQTVQNRMVNINVPEKLSQLENDDYTVKDEQYVHTDNNYTFGDKIKLSRIEDGAQVNEITKIQRNGVEIPINKTVVDIPVPLHTSELINDTTFITNSVNDLVNYYVKEDTFTKGEVVQLISAIDALTLEIVEILPTENISITTIYLVPNGKDQDNIYDEYVYINSHWEKIGTTEVDLTNYYTKEEVENKFIKQSEKGMTIPTLDANKRVIETASNALQLNQKDEAYYRNYNNLVNKPTHLPNAGILYIEDNEGHNHQYNGKEDVGIVIDKEFVGLSNVDNTSDVNKPISRLQQEALNRKASSISLNGDRIELRNDTEEIVSISLSSINKGDGLSITGNVLTLLNRGDSSELDSVQLPEGVSNKVITDGDFNTQTIPGFYTMKGNGTLNAPETGSYWGLLVVKSDTGSSYFQQIATKEGTNKLFVRNGTGTWKDYSLPNIDTLPIGTIIPYGGTTLPTGFIWCDGAAVSKTTYADLWKAIGDNFLNGRTAQTSTFYVPDMNGKTPVGKAKNATSSFYTLGKQVGEEEHKLIVDEIPSHAHDMYLRLTGAESSGYGLTQSGSFTNRVVVAGAQSGITIYGTGGGESHNNIQPSLVTNYVIRATKTSMVPEVAQVIDTLTSSSTTDALSANQGKLLNDKISYEKKYDILGRKE